MRKYFWALIIVLGGLWWGRAQAVSAEENIGHPYDPALGGVMLRPPDELYVIVGQRAQAMFLYSGPSGRLLDPLEDWPDYDYSLRYVDGPGNNATRLTYSKGVFEATMPQNQGTYHVVLTISVKNDRNNIKAQHNLTVHAVAAPEGPLTPLQNHLIKTWFYAEAIYWQDQAGRLFAGPPVTVKPTRAKEMPDGPSMLPDYRSANWAAPYAFTTRDPLMTGGYTIQHVKPVALIAGRPYRAEIIGKYWPPQPGTTLTFEWRYIANNRSQTRFTTEPWLDWPEEWYGPGRLDLTWHYQRAGGPDNALQVIDLPVTVQPAPETILKLPEGPLVTANIPFAQIAQETVALPVTWPTVELPDPGAWTLAIHADAMTNGVETLPTVLEMGAVLATAEQELLLTALTPGRVDLTGLHLLIGPAPLARVGAYTSTITFALQAVPTPSN